ncbi:MAG: hypothetical protein QME71_05980 [Dehalococcoidia bacterium]|nr:hypothetical protein [Dehalococcoidia bacterium]
MNFSDELRRDLSSLRRYLWLLLLVLALALAAAAASFFFAPRSKDASFRHSLVLSSLPPLFGPDTLPTMDDFARLALSDEALSRTSEALREQGVGLSANALWNGLSARARHNENAIDFTASFDSDDVSLAVARAWSEVFVALAPERAPDLQREASASYQRQLERAQAEVERKRERVAELGLVTGGGADAADPSQVAYEAKATVLAEKEAERTEIANLIATLGAVDPSSLSADQLRLLLAGVLPPEAAASPDLTVPQAIAALELRARSLDATVLALRQEVQQLATAIDESGTRAQQALTELAAAEENYEVASRLAQSYEVVGDLMQVGVFTVKAPHLEETGVLSYASRFAAAGAFALVAGMLGAVGLGQLQSRGRKGPSARRESAIPTHMPQRPVEDKAPLLRARFRPRRRRRPGGNAYLQFGASALAVLLLVGILGTLLPRKTLRHRPRE